MNDEAEEVTPEEPPKPQTVAVDMPLVNWQACLQFVSLGVRASGDENLIPGGQLLAELKRQISEQANEPH